MLRNIDFDFNGEDTTYLTHSLHPYPAKFPPQLPKRLLKEFAKAGETVLDPFCGSGTTLVEARLQGLNAIGVDVNGLSCLLSKVKATPLTNEQQTEIYKFSNLISNVAFNWEFGNRSTIKIKEIEGIKHWFQKNVSEELSFILNEIEKIKDTAVNEFLKISLSSIIVRVSNQESDTRYAAINKNIPDCFTFKLFLSKLKDYNNRIIHFSKLVPTSTKLTIYNADSRDLSFIEPESIDLIITSPPYANTYDYYLYHKFRKRWLNIDVHFAQYNEIGSRREYSSLKKNSIKWIDDLKKCFMEMNKVLKNEGIAFIIIGDSVIAKELIKIDKIIIDFSKSVGFKVCEIISSDLASHSRIFNPSFAKKGKKEHLIMLLKDYEEN